MRFGYPIFLDLHGVAVLVVGAGPVAARKIRGLTEAGADVHLVAPDVHESVERSSLASLHERPYERSDLGGKRLVITATGISAVDAAVAADAGHLGVWVNAADQPGDCTFILPAIARADNLTVAVSSDGTAPAVASWLRDRIRQEVLDDETRMIAAEIAARRRQIHDGGGSTELVDWRAEIEARRDR